MEGLTGRRDAFPTPGAVFRPIAVEDLSEHLDVAVSLSRGSAFLSGVISQLPLRQRSSLAFLSLLSSSSFNSRLLPHFFPPSLSSLFFLSPSLSIPPSVLNEIKKRIK